MQPQSSIVLPQSLSVCLSACLADSWCAAAELRDLVSAPPPQVASTIARQIFAQIESNERQIRKGPSGPRVGRNLDGRAYTMGRKQSGLCRGPKRRMGKPGAVGPSRCIDGTLVTVQLLALIGDQRLRLPTRAARGRGSRFSRGNQGLKILRNFEARACIGLQKNLDFINKNVRLVIRTPFPKLRYYFCCINVLKIHSCFIAILNASLTINLNGIFM